MNGEMVSRLEDSFTRESLPTLMACLEEMATRTAAPQADG
jgi:hypothetical protein